MESVTPILEFKKTCVSYTKQTMAVRLRRMEIKDYGKN